MLSQPCAVSPPLLGGGFAASAPRVRTPGLVPAQEARRMRSLARELRAPEAAGGKGGSSRDCTPSRAETLRSARSSRKGWRCTWCGRSRDAPSAGNAEEGKGRERICSGSGKKRQWLSLDWHPVAETEKSVSVRNEWSSWGTGVGVGSGVWTQETWTFKISASLFLHFPFY